MRRLTLGAAAGVLAGTGFWMTSQWLESSAVHSTGVQRLGNTIHNRNETSVYSAPPVAMEKPALSAAPSGLSLRGVMVADDPQIASAIIAGQAGENVYGVGDQIADGVVITDILIDRVILAVGSDYMVLRLEDGDVAPQAAGEPAGHQMIRALRDALFDGPEKILALLDARPVARGGQQVGYQVYPPEVPEFIDTLGLEPGDIVTRINDIPLESGERLRTALATLVGTDRFELTVYRNGVLERLFMGMPR